MDEAFYVIDGSGTFILNDVRRPVEKGGSIFIPKNAWHGFQNPDRELLLLWIVTPPGLEAFFRERWSAAAHPLPATDVFAAELNYFAACVKDNRQPDLCPPGQSALSVALMRFMLESRERKGEPVLCPI